MYLSQPTPVFKTKTFRSPVEVLVQSQIHTLIPQGLGKATNIEYDADLLTEFEKHDTIILDDFQKKNKCNTHKYNVLKFNRVSF